MPSAPSSSSAVAGGPQLKNRVASAGESSVTLRDTVYSPAAELEWRGDATVRAIKVLQANGRLEENS